MGRFGSIAFLTLIFLSSFRITGTAQIIYEPLKNDVYKFLDREEIKGNITLTSEVRPFSRKYIASKLVELSKRTNKLNSTETEELRWLLDDYGIELEDTSLNRLRLFSYSDENFDFVLSPIAAYGISQTGNKKGHSRRIGLRVYTTYSDWFGASLHMTDNGEFGDNVDNNKQFSSKRGADEISAPNGIEFSDVRVQLNIDFKWGAISLMKDYSCWGQGYFGNVILSDKAPSFTKLYLELKPTDWIRFYYTYGWIHSGVIDSSVSHISNRGSLFEQEFNEFFPKYFVSNFITISPIKRIDFSLGNYIVYAGDVRPEMFIPFNFFKYMDRDTGKKSIQDGNGGLQFDLAVKYPDNYKFYSSLLLDVTSIRELMNAEFQHTWYGVTIGMKRINLFADNLDFILEYTRINPWVYEHKIDLTTYKHLDYSIGHWLGQNADQLRIEANYRPIRGLNLKGYYERLRKGGMKDLKFAYEDPDVEPFLYGPIRKDYVVGIEAKYEIIHEFFIEAKYKYSDIKDQQIGRTPEFLLGNNNNLSLSLYYGLP